MIGIEKQASERHCRFVAFAISACHEYTRLNACEPPLSLAVDVGGRGVIASNAIIHQPGDRDGNASR